MTTATSSMARVRPGPALPLPATSRSGLRWWLRSLRLMLRFDLSRARRWAPFMVVIQLMMGAGMAVTYGFFYPEVSRTTALYIATGTPTLALIPLGLVMIPGDVGQQRLEGSFELIWSLPAPRSAQAVSTFLLYMLLSLPGTMLALLVAAWRYSVSLAVSPLLLPAVLLCALTAVTVGFGLALAIPDPLVTNLVTNALVFVVLLFSPVVFPATNLPSWLASVHQVLPFQSMAVVIRAGLTTGPVGGVGQSFLVLAAWTVAGCALTGWVVGRRR